MIEDLPPPVSILGMHRCGTSCLAGCLEERGLYLGEVVNSSPFNRKGNKENVQLRAINDDVLAYSGGAWDRPPKRLVWNDALRRRRDEHIASQRLHKVWGFKDPRTILTFPFWLEAFPHMRFVGTFRHPAAAVSSLIRRPGLIPAVPPLDLWKEYNLKLLKLVNQHLFPLICFDWPSDIYIPALEGIARYLGLEDYPQPSYCFFEESLRTNFQSENEVHSFESEEMLIYEKLLKEAVNSMKINA